MYPDKKKDIEVIKALKEKKFIDADMAGYITDKIVELMPNLKGSAALKVYLWCSGVLSRS